MIAQVSKKGSILIPREIRERYGIHPGDEIEFEDIGWAIKLIPVAKGDSATPQPQTES